MRGRCGRARWWWPPAATTHTPIIPADAAGLPPGIRRLTAAEYRDPAQLPPGGVLVAGSGLSGAQIAEDLRAAGRDVHLAVGAAPRISRRHRGRDVSKWLERMGFHDRPVGKHELGEGVRDTAAGVVSGLDGGRDIDLRAHALAGLRLYGRLLGIDAAIARFAGDLVANLDRADAANAAIKTSIDRWITSAAIEAPSAPPDAPPWTPPPDTPRTLDLARAGIGAIVWCIGFRPAFGWIAAPVFDERGRPVHRRGVMVTPGLYFLGLPWLHSWGSGRMSGVARDAEYLAQRIGGGYG